MSRIEVVESRAFYSPTAKRRFFTKRAALSAEAAALIRRKYPTEREEYDFGGLVYGGWHWANDVRLRKLHQRLIRIMSKAERLAA